MADEVSFQISASLRNGFVKRDIFGSFKSDQTNAHVNRYEIQIGTAETTITYLDLTPGYWFFQNLGNDTQDPTVTISFGPLIPTRQPGATLKVGDWAFFPGIPGATGIACVSSDDINQPYLLYEIWGL